MNAKKRKEGMEWKAEFCSVLGCVVGWLRTLRISIVIALRSSVFTHPPRSPSWASP
jgi:hypothetical protein